ncbi:UNVERIFIED_CONTAM: Retrovirus-related Pol polyprotein from transposon TNT 1-94 [Sesamum radiatum]|uniref:Retrovirus-related Pol polyprotein from transposon TNT 1-94 n=1 Tax=Sesamum radiatum TaxID=300843 RepID=A0AAW2V3Z0_SESRA
MVIVNQMRKYGEKITDQTVVEKLLRSLTRKYESTVAAIEESKDLTVITIDELLGSLQSHEDRHKSYEENSTENAFQAKLKLTKETNGGHEVRSGNNYNRGGSSYRGRRDGRGYRGGGRSGDRQHPNDDGQNNRKFECYYCHKPGHIERYCRTKQHDEKKQILPKMKMKLKVYFLLVMLLTFLTQKCGIWIGSSSHMTANSEVFISLDRSAKTRIKMADGTIRNTEGKGVIKLNSGEGSCIKDVLYVPDLDSNLLSVGQFLREGYSLLFEDFSCTVFTDKTKKNLLLKVPMSRNNMFPLVIRDENWLWHHRYGHLNFKSLSLLSNQNLVDGLPMITHIDAVCESCVVGKQHRDSFPKNSNKRASEVAELIHADVCGPMQTPSLNNNRYFVVFVDDFSRMTWVYFVKEKSEVFSIFRKFKASIEKQSENAVKVLRTDRGGEFVSAEFNSFCEEMGIHRQLTTSYTPQQNGVAERKNRSLVEMAKSMLKAKCLSKSFWAKQFIQRRTCSIVVQRQH